MKIVATVTDVSDVVHAGGNGESKSVVIDLGEALPKLIMDYLRDKENEKTIPNYYSYRTLKFSILEQV
jgi:hypothetical protein